MAEPILDDPTVDSALESERRPGVPQSLQRKPRQPVGPGPQELRVIAWMSVPMAALISPIWPHRWSSVVRDCLRTPGAGLLPVG